MSTNKRRLSILWGLGFKPLKNEGFKSHANSPEFGGIRNEMPSSVLSVSSVVN